MRNVAKRSKIAPHTSCGGVYVRSVRKRARMWRFASRNGLLRTIDGPRTDVADIATYEYRLANAPGCDTSPATCAWRKGDLWKTTNALGHATEIVAYDGAGRALKSIDANDVITQFTYHPRGWLASRTVKGATTGEDAITTFTYTPTGEVSRITVFSPGQFWIGTVGQF
jgi:YD repeat-containing protein